jgi:hypothetical protein
MLRSIACPGGGDKPPGYVAIKEVAPEGDSSGCLLSDLSFSDENVLFSYMDGIGAILGERALSVGLLPTIEYVGPASDSGGKIDVESYDLDRSVLTAAIGFVEVYLLLGHILPVTSTTKPFAAVSLQCHGPMIRDGNDRRPADQSE